MPGLLPRRMTLPRVFLAALLALSAFLSLRDFYSYQFGFTPDSAEYTVLAKALAQGPTYALHLATFFSEPTQYPFGFPMLLIPFVLVAPLGFETAALLSLAATLASVAVLFLGWRWMVPEVDERWRYPVAAMFALSPTTVSLARLVLSDAPFTLAVVLVLFFAARALRKPETRRVWLHLGVACFFMVFIRSLGLVCLGALVFYMVVALRARALKGLLWVGATLAVLVGVVMALTPVTLIDLIPAQYVNWYLALGPLQEVQMVGGEMRPAPAVPDPTADDTTFEPGIDVTLSYLLDHIYQDLRRMVLLTGGGEREVDFANRIGLPWLVNVPAWGMVGLMALGAAHWILSARARGLPVLSVFMFVGGAYAVVVFFWRGAGERIWFPVAPHLYLTFLLGIAVVAQTLGAFFSRVRGRRGGEAAAGGLRFMVGVIAAVTVAWMGLAITRDLTLTRSVDMWGDLRSRALIFDRYIEPDAVVMSDWAAYDSLYRGGNLVSLPFNGAEAILRQEIRKYAVRYLVVAADETFENRGHARRTNRVRELTPVLKDWAARGLLTPVYQNGYPLMIWRVGDVSP